MAATSYPNATNELTYQEDREQATRVQSAYRCLARLILATTKQAIVDGGGGRTREEKE